MEMEKMTLDEAARYVREANLALKTARREEDKAKAETQKAIAAKSRADADLRRMVNCGS